MKLKVKLIKKRIVFILYCILLLAVAFVLDRFFQMLMFLLFFNLIQGCFSWRFHADTIEKDPIKAVKYCKIITIVIHILYLIYCKNLDTSLYSNLFIILLIAILNCLTQYVAERLVVKSLKLCDNDYNDYNDYRGRDRDYDMRYDGAGGSEKEYHEDLKRWSEKLKKKDRFNIKKEDVISQAKQMGVKFDEFTEDEFYVVYLMMISDYKTVSNEFRTYLGMAKEWLMDDDIEVSPSEKLCIYLYEIVKGEGIK